MRLALTQTVREEISIIGGTTDSVFKKSESWLLESSDRQETIQKIGCIRKAKRYRSVMDFIFCELFVKYRPSCFKFYEGEGPPLREILTEEEINNYDDALLRCLYLAYDLCNTERKLSWKTILENLLKKAS
jgi:hypothetical protein